MAQMARLSRPRLSEAAPATERREDGAGHRAALQPTLGEAAMAVQRRAADSPRQMALRSLAGTMADAPKQLAQRRLAETMQAGRGVVQGAFIDQAKIGLELTFESEDSKRFFTNDGVPVGREAAATAWWNRIRGEWKDLAEGQEIDGVEKDVNANAGDNKDFGHHTDGMTNTRFNYSPKGEDEAFGGWWWQLSADPGVVEIQSDPAPGAAFEAEEGIISQIVDMDIFGLAPEFNLQPGGGGGHVNVDFETGFGANYALIAKILASAENVIGELRGKDHADPERSLVDFDNEPGDPFIHSDRTKLPVKKSGQDDILKYKNLIGGDERDRSGDWQRDVYARGAAANSKDKFSKFRDAHAAWLFEHPGSGHYRSLGEVNAKHGERLDASNAEKVLHYQAINIDHILEDDPSARRLEFRFFGAQKNLADIVASIKLIGKIKEHAEQR